MYKSSARVLCVERYARWLSSSIRNGTSATPPIGSNELNNDSDRANARSAADVEGVANRLSARPLRGSQGITEEGSQSLKMLIQFGPIFCRFCFWEGFRHDLRSIGKGKAEYRGGQKTATLA